MVLRVSATNLKNGNSTSWKYDQQRDIEPYWQAEDNWLCTVEFLPSNAPEDRAVAADRRLSVWLRTADECTRSGTRRRS